MISVIKSDILKGIGIILVILTHIVGAWGIRYATPLGGIGVSIFLFISAYGLNESFKKNGLSSFWRKRILKVLVPYWIIVFADFIMMRKEMSVLLSNIFLITTPNFMWFIKYIIFNYIIFYFINKYVANINKKYLCYILIGIGVFFLGGPLQAEQAFIFFIGVVNSDIKYMISFKRYKKGIVTSFLLIIVGIISLAIKQLPIIRNSNKYLYYVVETLIKNSIAIGLIMFIVYTSYKVYKVFYKVGKISYELYLTHAIFFFIVKEETSVIRTIGFLVVTIIASVLLNKLLNKIELLKLKQVSEK